MDPAYCHARLPNAGLGNKMLVWAKAYTFAHLNHLPLRVTGWSQLQKAPLIHGLDLRLYWNYFRRVDQVPRLARWRAERLHRVVCDPPVARMQPEPGAIYLFSQVPHWADYFGDFREYRDDVRHGLIEMLTSSRVRELERQTAPVISVNVRMGDFRKLQAHENFKDVGGVRTPLAYFLELIQNLHKVTGRALPVEVVSDGFRHELQPLLELPAVSMAPRRSKIVDILIMSRSRVVIASSGSTFSYWAGFLGDCALIHHPDHIHQPVRPDDVNRRWYEGPLVGPPEAWPPLFLQNLREI